MHCIHTNLSEDVSFRRVIRLASKTECPVYFVHVSAGEGVESVGQARMLGLPVYGETLHNYACFSADSYREENGMKYHTYPSLKSEGDRKMLWEGLLDGRLSTLATDLVSTTWAEKIRFKTVADVTGGHNGIETRMGIAYSVGAVELGMSLQRFVDITSTNAAKIFGLYPQKGAISPGSDADICIIDPSFDRDLTLDDLHLEDYSIWEGWHAHGWPETVLLRGKVVVDQRKLTGSPTDGQLVPSVDPPRSHQTPHLLIGCLCQTGNRIYSLGPLRITLRALPRIRPAHSFVDNTPIHIPAKESWQSHESQKSQFRQHP